MDRLIGSNECRGVQDWSYRKTQNLERLKEKEALGSMLWVVRKYTEFGEPKGDVVKKRSMILVIQEYTKFGETEG